MLLINLGKDTCAVAPVEMPLQPPPQEQALACKRPLLLCLVELECREDLELAGGRLSLLPAEEVLGRELPWSLDGAHCAPWLLDCSQ